MNQCRRHSIEVNSDLLKMYLIYKKSNFSISGPVETGDVGHSNISHTHSLRICLRWF